MDPSSYKCNVLHAAAGRLLLCCLRSRILIFISLCLKGMISWEHKVQMCKVLTGKEISSKQSPKNNVDTFFHGLEDNGTQFQHQQSP